LDLQRGLNILGICCSGRFIAGNQFSSISVHITICNPINFRCDTLRREFNMQETILASKYSCFGQYTSRWINPFL